MCETGVANSKTSQNYFLSSVGLGRGRPERRGGFDLP